MLKCCAVLLLPVLLSGCALTFVKKYPKDKPFVYETNVKVRDAKNATVRNELEERLQEQLDDSIRVRTRSYPLWNTISRPPAYDSNNVVRTRAFMNALMRSLGYFASRIEDTAVFKTVRDQQRTIINFEITPGKNLTLDSVDYALTSPAWQQIAKLHSKDAVLKKGQAYTKAGVAEELDRLITLLRNNGYYKVSKEDIYAEVDTVAEALIDPTLDEFEQAILLEQLRRTRENPTIDVIFKQRPVRDSTHIRPYYISKVTIYPDVPVAIDTFENVRRDTMRIGNFFVITRSEKFHRRFLTDFTALKPGTLYRQDNYFRTINTFNQLGAWAQANVDVFESLENDSTLDVEITLYPAKKFTAIFDLEVSRNNANNVNADLVAASNLFGVGFNVGFRNRNFARQSIQTTTNARVGFELGKNVFQTLQTSLAHNIYIPKFVWPFSWWIRNQDSLTSPRTVISLNGSYTDRRLFFNLLSTNVAFGYEWGKRNHVWFARLLNVEYTSLNKSDSLRKLEDRNPYLRYAFNDGLVVSMQGAYRWQKQTGRHFNAVRIGVEESGALTGLSKSMDINARLFRFVRADVEYRHWLQYTKSAMVFRLFGGMGFAYGDSSRGVKERTLPFFKQYVAGGPNSMRAWQVRQLGWGSNFPKDTIFRDRFGDIQLEANFEYRFQIGTLPGGIKIGSAFYVDAGNIWLRKTFNDPDLENSDFNIGRLGKDLAIGTGTGLRFDFNFFLIRIDYAYKVKDPQRKTDEGKWFYNWRPFNGQLQLGINYPF
ncbi:MAG: BamA/TamA family outer membrane protein [Chitinophagaceae bacterium]